MAGVLWKFAGTCGFTLALISGSVVVAAGPDVSPVPGLGSGTSGARTAQSSQPTLGGGNSIITLEQPAASRFVFTATQKSGRIVLSGNAPSADSAKVLGTAGVDASGLKPAKGAPAGFDAAAAAGLEILALLDEGKLEFDGKSWSLTGTAKDPLQAMNAEAAFKAADLKNWGYAVELPKSSVAALPTISPYSFKAEKLPAGTIALSGYLPTAGLQAYLADRVAGKVVDTTKLGGGAPDDFAGAVVSGVDALQRVDEGALVLKNGSWSFTARTDDPEVAAETKAALAGASETAGWQVAITAPAALPPVANALTWKTWIKAPPVVPSVTASGAAAPSTEVAVAPVAPVAVSSPAVAPMAPAELVTAPQPAQTAAPAAEVASISPSAGSTDLAVTPPLELCRQELADFSARNSILFQSGRAQMTDASIAALGELAADLNRCPDAAISVEGHTDADGADDLNLALSVARAEAVVAQLVALGVGEQRLYAVGYGESLPVAPNDTAKGKQANRRIVFTIADDNQ